MYTKTIKVCDVSITLYYDIIIGKVMKHIVIYNGTFPLYRRKFHQVDFLATALGLIIRKSNNRFLIFSIIFKFTTIYCCCHCMKFNIEAKDYQR